MAEYIEREVLIAELAKCTIISDDLYCMGIMDGVDAAKKKVSEVQAADVAPVVHGRWEFDHVTETDRFAVVKCSNCGHKAFEMAFYVRDGNYCPNCGARMDGDG